MKPDISEFSYGYAVTEELVAAHGARIVAAPTFPSLYEEGKSGGGYDVKIPLCGTPVFLQFKLSDYLKRKNAKEHVLLSLALPYYRMHLRPLRHSQQHQLLLDLESSGESVYYVAPEFHTPRELNRHYLARSVVVNSAAFAPSAIGVLPDDKEHYVVFEKGASHGWRCSDDPKQVERTTLASRLKALRAKERKFGEEGLIKLTSLMVEVIRQRTGIAGLPRSAREDAEAIAEQRTPLESAGFLARTFFSSELLIVE
ncbi:hypothetical protein GCM10028862_08700 [Luteimonas pelagia]